MDLSHDSSCLPSLVEMDSLTDLPEELKPFYPLGDEDGLEVAQRFDLPTPAASSSPFFEEEEEEGYSASLHEEVASSPYDSTLASPPLAHGDRLFDPTSSPNLSLTPPESPSARLEAVLLANCSTAAADNNDETQQPHPTVQLEQTFGDMTSGDKRLTFPPSSAFTTPPATLHQPGSPQASTVEEEERPIFEVLSHRLWPLPAGMLVGELNHFIVVQVGNPCDVVIIGGRSQVDFQLPVIEPVASGNAAKGWRAVPAQPPQAYKRSVPFFSFSLCYEETMEEKNEREKKEKRKREIPWTPIILHFGEHKVLAVVAFEDRDLDKRMFEMLSSPAMTEELAAPTPTLDIVLRLYESAELAYWMDKGLWDARKITPKEPQEPHQKKPRQQPLASTGSYNGLQQQEAWTSLFADQYQDLIMTAGTFNQETWCLYWDLQKIRRNGKLKLNKNTPFYLFLDENEVFRRTPHSVEWVLLPERKKLCEEPYRSLLLLTRDGTRRIFRYDYREAGKKEYVEGDLENRKYFSTTTLNRLLDEEGGDEFLQRIPPHLPHLPTTPSQRSNEDNRDNPERT
ncbi:hypothetical protein QOT17_003375 [Balamuthia mandrillaris]